MLSKFVAPWKTQVIDLLLHLQLTLVLNGKKRICWTPHESEEHKDSNIKDVKV